MRENRIHELLDRPTYVLGEAARYLAIPSATLRSWVVGRQYPVKGGARRFRPLIDVSRGETQLSFSNLVESHIIRGLRRAYRIDLSRIREAIEYANHVFQDSHPLLNPKMKTDGVELFWEWGRHLENLNQGGQFAIRGILDAHLKRVSWSGKGPVRLFPFRRWEEDVSEEMPLMIDPRISFGRLVLSGTGIPTSVIAERFQGGEDVRELAEDYGVDVTQIEDAIRRESKLVDAA